MRILLALLAVAALAAGAYVLVSRDTAEPAGQVGSLTLVGDSLNVGTDPDRVGRQTWEGVEELRRLRASLAPIVVVSLGTNDGDGTEAEFRDYVAEAIGIVGPRRCLLWATVVRAGAPRDGFNAVLEDARADHPNVRLVDWASLVQREPETLAFDTVHGTPEGYGRRAEETAAAVRRCPAA
jgi:lysophospholipase L1-like esterase